MPIFPRALTEEKNFHFRSSLLLRYLFEDSLRTFLTGNGPEELA